MSESGGSSSGASFHDVTEHHAVKHEQGHQQSNTAAAGANANAADWPPQIVFGEFVGTVEAVPSKYFDCSKFC